MKQITIFFIALAFSFAPSTYAQLENISTAPFIEDEMTVDPEQNSQWRLGQYAFSAKPKSMWEFGLNAGYAFISGDVEAPAFSGYGLGVNLQKSISYVFSLRFEGIFTSSKGRDARFTPASTLRPERTFQQNGNNTGAPSTYLVDGNGIHRNYQTNNISFSIAGVVNIGNILFHKERNKWGLYGLVGAGLNIPSVNINLLDGGKAYDFRSISNGLDLTNRSDRKESRSRLKDLLDGDYESAGGKENDIITLSGDEKSVIPHVNFGLGISKKLSRRISLGFEYQIMLSDNDLLDGFEYRSEIDKSNNLDIPHFASLRLGIAIGNSEKRAEPLYWLNPLDALYYDIAEMKQRPKFDLTDSDGDGVIDMIDQEKDSPAGSPVDTRGVALDSDGDGVLDYKDEEPYSPPGYDVDANGVSQVADAGNLTNEEVSKIIDETLPATPDINAFQFPVFPNPVPEWSKRKEFTVKQLFPGAKTFGDVDNNVRMTLMQAGFFNEKKLPRFNYFQIKSKDKFKGYAVVTEFERIKRNGEYRDEDRFTYLVTPKKKYKIFDLPFRKSPGIGLFRFFAFLISEDFDSTPTRGFSKNEALQHLSWGSFYNKLPLEIKVHPIKEEKCNVQILVYEYEHVEKEIDGSLVKIRWLPIEKHLKGACISDLLKHLPR